MAFSNLPAGVAAALNGAAAAPRLREAQRAARLDLFMSVRSDMQPYRGASAADIGAPQYGPLWSRSGLRGLGGLDALTVGTANDLKAFLASVRAATKRLEDSLPGAIMSWFQSSVVGADSSVAAGREDLRQQKKLLAIAETKVAGFLASGDEQAAAEWLRNAKAGRWDDVSAGVAAGNQMSSQAFVDQVVIQSGKDAAAAAAKSGEGFLVVLKYLPYILVGGAAIYGGVKLMAWRRASRLAAAQPGTAGLRSRRRRRTRRSR